MLASERMLTVLAALVISLPGPAAAQGDEPITLLGGVNEGLVDLTLDEAGNPVLLFADLDEDSPSHDELVLLRCADPSCDDGAAATIVDDVTGWGVTTPHVALDGAGVATTSFATNGVFGEEDRPQGTWIARCADLACSTPPVTPIHEHSSYVSALASAPDGRTFYAGFYRLDAEAGEVVVISCPDGRCDGDVDRTVLPAPPRTSFTPVAATFREDGTPVLVSEAQVHEDDGVTLAAIGALVHDCADQACTESTATFIDGAAVSQRGESEMYDLDVAFDGDLPVIGFREHDGGGTARPGIARCADPGCEDVQLALVGAVPTQGETSGLSVAIEDGVTYAAYGADGRWWVAACDDPMCQGNAFVSYPAPNLLRGAGFRLHVHDGVPLLSWFEAREGQSRRILLGLRCTAPECEAGAASGGSVVNGRVGTDDPAATALGISGLRFAAAGTSPQPDPGDTARWAVLSRDDAFADSLAGSVLTGAGPLLFTATSHLDGAVLAEMDRVLGGDGTVYLLGGINALAPDVEDALVAAGYTTHRLAGASRVETAIAVADEAATVLAAPDEVFIVRADSPPDNPTAAWADSISVGAWSASSARPILLTPTDLAHPAVAAWLDAHPDVDATVVGGEAAVSAAVGSSLGTDRRVAGPNRFASAVAVADQLWGAAAGEGYAVSGSGPDGWLYGLAGAGLAADMQRPLLLATADSEPPETGERICATGTPAPLTIVAGPAEVPDDVVAALGSC